MRIEQLMYFLEITKTGSINKAAENLFVTQPGLSDAIKKLESELGLTLLERYKTGVELTGDGKIVAKHAVKILSDYQEMMADLSGLSHQEEAMEETISIATGPLFAASILIDVIRQFHADYPRVQIRYMEVIDTEVLSLVKAQKVAMGFCAYTPKQQEDYLVPHSDLILQQLFQDRLVACLSRKSPLAINKTLDDAILSSTNQVCCFSSAIPDADNIIAISNNIAVQIDIILQGDAIACMPTHAFNRCFSETKGLVSRPITPVKITQFYAVRLAQPKLSPMQSTFMQYVEKQIANLHLPLI